jgi:hypothetical protein
VGAELDLVLGGCNQVDGLHSGQEGDFVGNALNEQLQDRRDLVLRQLVACQSRKEQTTEKNATKNQKYINMQSK